MSGKSSLELSHPERWKLTMLTHFSDMHRRNDLLQQKLDEANARIARMQAEALDKELPLPPRGDAMEQLRRRSKAVRRLLEARL